MSNTSNPRVNQPGAGAAIPDDYAGAAARHYGDGVLLHERRRFSNADQLFGFAAECAIKSALVTLPGCAPAGALSSGYREHIDVLWGRVQVQSIQRRFGPLAGLLKRLPPPFADWSTSQRYWREQTVSETAVQSHKKAAARLLGSVGILGRRAEAP